MTPTPEHRKLAAIMFTDMVGFSSLALRKTINRRNPYFSQWLKKIGLDK